MDTSFWEIFDKISYEDLDRMITGSNSTYLPDGTVDPMVLFAERMRLATQQ